MTAAEVVARLAAATHAALVVEGVGTGAGRVTSAWDGAVLVLTAEGTWAPGGRDVRWRSVSRWRAEGGAVVVAWVRPGDWARAVLDEGSEGVWTGRAAHVCGADRYACTLRLGPEAVEVVWTVRGPTKAARVATAFATGRRGAARAPRGGGPPPSGGPSGARARRPRG